MTLLWPLLAGVALMRLAELRLARRNTQALLAEGGHEVAPRHYPLIVGLHVAWLAAMAWTIPPNQPADPWLLAMFALLLALRVWVIASLGRFWTTRIITLPGAPLIRRGPYRFLRHPNYVVVAAEIAVLPLTFGAWRLAIAFSLLNGVLLSWRIGCEEQALADRHRLMPRPPERSPAPVRRGLRPKNAAEGESR